MEYAFEYRIEDMTVDRLFEVGALRAACDPDFNAVDWIEKELARRGELPSQPVLRLVSDNTNH